MTKPFIITLFISISFSQSNIDSLKLDSILNARVKMLAETKNMNRFNMSYDDSIKPVWKQTFGSQSGELDRIADHIKNAKYEREKFVGLRIDLLAMGRSFLEWLGLKDPSTDENGNYLDDYEQELYVEKLWKQRMRDKFELDSIKLILEENN